MFSTVLSMFLCRKVFFIFAITEKLVRLSKIYQYDANLLECITTFVIRFKIALSSILRGLSINYLYNCQREVYGTSIYL